MPKKSKKGTKGVFQALYAPHSYEYKPGIVICYSRQGYWLGEWYTPGFQGWPEELRCCTLGYCGTEYCETFRDFHKLMERL